MWVEIEVTEEDLSLGIKGQPYKCPVALAINRQLKYGLYCSVAVYTFTIYSVEENWLLYRALPREATDLILTFDRQNSLCKPIVFGVEISEELLNIS